MMARILNGYAALGPWAGAIIAVLRGSCAERKGAMPAVTFDEELVKLEAIGFVLNELAEQFETDNPNAAAVLNQLSPALDRVIADRRGGDDDRELLLGTEAIEWLDSHGWCWPEFALVPEAEGSAE